MAKMRKYIKGILVPAVWLALCWAALMPFPGCKGPETLEESVSILSRVPKDAKMVFSARPRMILNSKVIKVLLEARPETRDLAKEKGEIKSKLGLDPTVDIEHLAVFALKSQDSFEKNWGLLAQGNMQDFFLDSILVFKEIQDSLCRIGDFEIHCLSVSRSENSWRLFLYFDKDELMLTASPKNMAVLLELKKGRGGSLAENQKMTAGILRLKYHDSLWFVVPTEEIMKDVMEKIRLKKPDFRPDLLEITSIHGGLHLNDDFGFCLQAECSGEETAKLLFDSVNGLLAIGKLTAGAVPQAREILDRLILEKKEKSLQVSFSLTLEDIQILMDLGGISMLPSSLSPGQFPTLQCQAGPPVE